MRLDNCTALRPRPLDQLEGLRLAYRRARPEDVLAGVYAEFPDEVALVSSFGADAAVLLHMVSRIDRDFPVLMGILMFISLAVVVFQLLTDIAYSFLDPRIRLG